MITTSNMNQYPVTVGEGFKRSRRASVSLYVAVAVHVASWALFIALWMYWLDI